MEEEEKKHVPKFSLFFFSFFFLWDFSLVLKLHIEEREQKKGKKKSIGVRRTRDAQKKKRVLNRGLEPRTFRLRYQSVSGAFLLGERSNQTV